MTSKIIKINYFGEETKSEEYNGKVLYSTSNGKLRHAHIYICFWSRKFYISKNQPKEAKVTLGLQKLLNLEIGKYFTI